MNNNQSTIQQNAYNNIVYHITIKNNNYNNIKI